MTTDPGPTPSDPGATAAAAGGADGPRYTVAAVASRLGVAPATLRTWDRRYGLGPSDHPAGAHRRYTPDDVERLLTMRRLVVDGVPPAHAAKVALTARAGASPPDGGTAATEPAAPAVDGAGRAATAGGGGRVLALPDATPEVRGLARAALALDGPAMTAVVRAALSERGVAAAWHGLLVPVLTAVGERWEATGAGVESEHLLSESTLLGLRAVRLAAQLDDAPRVLVGCVADDYHALPTHVLAAALAERGIAARVLGAAVPPDALAAAIRRVRPAVVFCWSSMPYADPGYLAAVPTLAPPVAVVVGGPGWVAERLPARVDVARDVPEAVSLVAARLGR